MRVVDEHECNLLKYQNHDEKDTTIAVQKMVQDTKSGIINEGWYLVNYREKEPDIAFGIRCCPYCGALLRK